MMPVKHILRCLLACCCLATPAGWAARAQQISLQATSVQAFASERPTDARLKSIEAILRKQLPQYRGFVYAGGGRSELAVPGRGAVNLGGGYTASFEAAASGEGRYRIGVQWKRGNQVLINTSLGMSRGVPALLGGPRQGDSTMVLVLLLR